MEYDCRGRKPALALDVSIKETPVRVRVSICLKALLFVLVACQPQQTNGNTAQPTPAATSIPGWQMYHDPGGHFTIEVPGSWRMSPSNAQQEFVYLGDTTSPTKVRDVTFYEPLGEVANKATQLTITVLYTLYDVAAQPTYLCIPSKQANTTFVGLPAHGTHTLDGIHPQVIAFATAAALYQITYGVPAEYPGEENNGLASAVPQATITARDGLAQRILATFVPDPKNPPEC